MLPAVIHGTCTAPGGYVLLCLRELRDDLRQKGLAEKATKEEGGKKNMNSRYVPTTYPPAYRLVLRDSRKIRGNNVGTLAIAVNQSSTSVLPSLISNGCVCPGLAWWSVSSTPPAKLQVCTLPRVHVVLGAAPIASSSSNAAG